MRRYMARSYIADLAGGTATTTIQISEPGTIKTVFVSLANVAVGKLEISRSGTSQIGTAQPTRDVLARLNVSGTAGTLNVAIDVPPQKVKVLDNVYIHQTGAGNIGSATLLA